MPEQRRTKRFPIRLPIRVVRPGGRTVPAVGETRNLSSSGVMFVSEAKIAAGERIEYTIQLDHDDGVPVTLHCLGKVMRSDGDEPCHIAATLERYEFVREH